MITNPTRQPGSSFGRRGVARTIAQVGALHPGAAQLALALEDEPAVERILGLQPSPAPLLGPKFEHVAAEPGDERFDAALGQADVLVVFPVLETGDRDGRAARERLTTAVRRALDAASKASTVVLWSSGIVYGAHPDNPVPLDEDMPLRPNFDFPPARALADVEGLVLDGSNGPGAATRVVLRGAAVWSPAWGSFLSRMLVGPAIVGVRGYDPPVQGLDPGRPGGPADRQAPRGGAGGRGVRGRRAARPARRRSHGPGRAALPHASLGALQPPAARGWLGADLDHCRGHDLCWPR